MRFDLGDFNLDVRAATAADVPLLMSFIRSMAEFENLDLTATEGDLRDALFGKNPAAQALLASVGERPAAYVVYFPTFATMTGRRGLWLDDIYVKPEYRGKGIAKALLTYLADLAVREGCGRFEWIVLDWNRNAIELYEGLGATVFDEWRLCRLTGESLENLARQRPDVEKGEQP
jgi:GNAT superfamily N-acetyltransferase